MDQQNLDSGDIRSIQQQQLDNAAAQLSGWSYKIFALFLVMIVGLELANFLPKETLVGLHQLNLGLLLAAPFVRTIFIAKVMMRNKDWLAVGGAFLTFLVVLLFLSTKII